MQNPKAYLFLHNVGKKNNIGNIVRSACAFGFEKVMYVSNRGEGSKKMKAMKEFHCFGNQGTYKQIDFQPFTSLEEAKKYLNENKIKVCGVEIGENSVPIHKHPFTGHTAFFLGNEGSGILPVHKAFCDYFVYIPQYSNKTACLNVSVAAGIVFHHFALWAEYPQSEVFGEKYQHQQEPIGRPKIKNESESNADNEKNQKDEIINQAKQNLEEEEMEEAEKKEEKINNKVEEEQQPEC